MGQYVSNINFRHRFTQIVVLVVAILACTLFSQVANAQRSGSKFTMDKKKYRVSVHKSSHRVCYVLWKKRTAAPNRSLFASNNRKSRSRQQLAETDEPARIAGAN